MKASIESCDGEALTLSVDGLKEGSVRHFRFRRGDEILGGFVVRHADGLSAYVNRCPHVTYSLDIGDGDVMCRDGTFIRCATHGALFRPDTGQCFMGPPLGAFLEALPIRRVEGVVEILIGPTTPSS